MKAMNIGLFLIVIFFAGCNRIPKPVPSTFVVVINSSGAPVPGAEVFQDGILKGTTDGTGTFVFSPPLATGTKLFARSLVFTQPSYRVTPGWVAHFYQTSRVVNTDGSVTDLTVSSPKVTQTLTVSPNNTLIGWHLTVSLDWDASGDEFNQLKTRFELGSDYLYNLTDGQFFIEQVEIADDGQLDASAEIAFKVDSFVWPHSTYPGGFLFAVGGQPNISMAPFDDQGVMWTGRTLIHELGHLAFGLADEYAGFNFLAQNYCTAALINGAAPADFRAMTFTPSGTQLTGARAACFMNDQSVTNKMCSAHPDNPHRNGNLQPGPCWNTVFNAYNDGPAFGAGAGSTPRWKVLTPNPNSRNALVGTLPKLPPGWEPKVIPTNRRYPGLLCEPVTVSDWHGSAAANGTVWVHPQAWRPFDYTVGRLDKDGKLVVRGVHNGDVIQSPFATLPFTCTIIP